MITKEEIEKAAKQYCHENNGDAFEYHAFIVGAEWIAKYYDAEQKDAAGLMAQAAAKIVNLKAALLEIKEKLNANK